MGSNLQIVPGRAREHCGREGKKLGSDTAAAEASVDLRGGLKWRSGPAELSCRAWGSRLLSSALGSSQRGRPPRPTCPSFPRGQRGGPAQRPPGLFALSLTIGRYAVVLYNVVIINLAIWMVSHALLLQAMADFKLISWSIYIYIQENCQVTWWQILPCTIMSDCLSGRLDGGRAEQGRWDPRKF